MRPETIRNDLGSLTANESVSELEKEAMEQYRDSAESIEEKFATLEREAEEQYFS